MCRDSKVGAPLAESLSSKEERSKGSLVLEWGQACCAHRCPTGSVQMGVSWELKPNQGSAGQASFPALGSRPFLLSDSVSTEIFLTQPLR